MDVSFQYAVDPKLSNSYTQAELYLIAGSPTVSQPFVWGAPVQTVALTGPGEYTFPTVSWVGLDDEFVIMVKIGGGGAPYFIWSGVTGCVRDGTAVPTPTDFGERPIRFVNSQPIEACQGSYGLHISRNTSYQGDRTARPYPRYLNLEDKIPGTLTQPTHMRVTMELAVSAQMPGNGNIDDQYKKYDKNGPPYVPVANNPLASMVDASGNLRILGEIRAAAGGNTVTTENSALASHIIRQDPTKTLIPIAWLTAQPIADTNTNALVPFDTTRIAGLDFFFQCSQVLVRSLQIELGVDDGTGNAFLGTTNTIQLDIDTDDYTLEDINRRWAQRGPGVMLRPFNDTRHWCFDPETWSKDFANLLDEGDVHQPMVLFSREVVDRMQTVIPPCLTDEEEYDVNYIALSRTQAVAPGVFDARNVFYSVIRRTFDEEGYLDISEVCKVYDGIKRRFVFPDIQFTAACPNNHHYQFQATLVDDRGNKMVGAWSPVLSPKNESITCRTERWADTATFQHLNGVFSLDGDPLYAAQLEDFNFHRVSELIVRVTGPRPQTISTETLWEQYTDTPPPASNVLSWATTEFEIQLVPVGWHEGQLIVNLQVYTYDEPGATPPPASVMTQIILDLNLFHGYVSDRLLFSPFDTVNSESGFEAKSFQGDYSCSVGSYNDPDTTVASFLVGGLPADIREGVAPLRITATVTAKNGAINLIDSPTGTKVFDLKLDTDQIIPNIDDFPTDSPCIALSNFSVQGPGGAKVLDDLTEYKLAEDPAGATKLFYSRWSSLDERQYQVPIPVYPALYPETSPSVDRVWRQNILDGGALTFYGYETGAPTPRLYSDFDILQIKFDGHPRFPFDVSSNQMPNNAIHMSGGNDFGWSAAYKLTPVIEFIWTSVDDDGLPVILSSTVALDLDWGLLAGRFRYFPSGVAETIWISKRELEDLGVFAIDEHFEEVAETSEITFRMAGYFMEAPTNQPFAVDFSVFAVSMLYDCTTAGFTTIGDEYLADIGKEGGDATLVFTNTEAVDYNAILATVAPDPIAMSFGVPVANRLMASNVNGAGMRINPVSTTLDPVAYVNLAPPALTIGGLDGVMGVGFMTPQGTDLIGPAGLATIDISTALWTLGGQAEAFVVVRTNFDRQFVSEFVDVSAGPGLVSFGGWSENFTSKYMYEPSNFGFGRVLLEEDSPAFYASNRFEATFPITGGERVVAVEFYVVALDADGPISVDIIAAVINDASPATVLLFDAAAFTPTYYDPEGHARVVHLPLGSDENDCEVHKAAAGLRSDKSMAMLHLRRDTFGTIFSDRLSSPDSFTLEDIKKVISDIRVFNSCYMVLFLRIAGVGYSVEIDGGGNWIVIDKSPEVTGYSRYQVDGEWDTDDDNPLTFYKWTSADLAVLPAGNVDDMILMIIPATAINATSIDFDDLHMTDVADALLYGETFDYRSQVDILRNWDVLHTPGFNKLDQDATLVTHPHLWFDAFELNAEIDRRAFNQDVVGSMDPQNTIALGDSVNQCKLPIIFSQEPDHVKYYQDDHYDEGGRGAVLVPNDDVNASVDETRAKFEEAYFWGSHGRGPNKRLLGLVYWKIIDCLGVPLAFRTVDFTAPECNCGGGPSGLLSISEMITHPKLVQIFTDDTFKADHGPTLVYPDFASGAVGSGLGRPNYDDYPAIWFKYLDQFGAWQSFDSTNQPGNPGPNGEICYYGGGGRVDPYNVLVPPAGRYITVWLGPNFTGSTVNSNKMDRLQEDAIINDEIEWTFVATNDADDKFAIGELVWIRNACAPDDGCRYNLCDIRSSEDPDIAGVYGEVTAVDTNGNVTIRFDAPVTAKFLEDQHAEIVISPPGAMGFYWEVSADLITEIEAGNPDPNLATIIWGFKHWDASEPLGSCGCGDGGGYLCDDDGETEVFEELIGDDTKQIIDPRVFIGLFNAPMTTKILLSDMNVGDDFVHVCNPEAFEDGAPVAILDEDYTNGFVATVVGRDVIRGYLYLDRPLPSALCGWPDFVPGTPGTPGFTTAKYAVIYRLPDFLPFNVLTASTFLRQEGWPEFGQVFVDFNTGQITFHPNQSEVWWVRYYDSNETIPMPKKAGLYRLVGVDACGKRTQPSENLTIVGTNRLVRFFAERGYEVHDGLIAPFQGALPEPSPEYLPPADGFIG